MSQVSVALSGGGHRAALFGLGVLLYLADAGKNREVANIASVSGGSITNGFVAQQLDFATCSKEDFEKKVVVPLAEQIARRGTLFAPLATKLYLIVLILSFLTTFIGPWLLPEGVWPRIGVFVIGVLWTAWVAGQRGNVCGGAYRKTLFSPKGSATRLSELERKTYPVLCATDLRTARQFYFAARFVYGYALGWASPGDIPLYKAVQASAAFPGGFPPTRLSTRRLDFRNTRTDEPQKWKPRQIVLADGGVYDNMADQWGRGFADRARRWPWLGQVHQEPDTLIVVNSSARREWMPFHARIPIWREIATLNRDMTVLYENTTAVRRQDLVRGFDRAQSEGEGMRGSLIMIIQSPYNVADYFADEKQLSLWPDRTRRAKEVLDLLGSTEREKWEVIAEKNSAVKTTLCALGTKVSARLLYQGYVLAMCNLRILLGYPLLPLPARSRFEDLTRGKITETPAGGTIGGAT